MGLFSDEKKVVVGTSVSRVIEDDVLPDAIKAGTIKSILRSGDVHEEVLESLFSSAAVRAERMYDYAAKKYPYGLPTGEFYSSTKGKPEIQAILDTQEGQEVFIEYSNFGPPNSLHLAWMLLVSDHGYNPATNELAHLTAQKGVPVYLEDILIGIPKSQANNYPPGSLAMWGPSPKAGKTPERPTASDAAGMLRGFSPVVHDSSVTDDYIEIVYVWRGVNYHQQWEIDGGSGSTLKRGTIRIPVTEALVQASEDYFHVRYRVGSQVKFWMYRMGTGTYPQLDALFGSVPTENGNYFPFLYFRFNKSSQIKNKTTEAYRTSKRMAKYLGMDYDTVAEAIDDNPDIDNVEQAMAMFAVPANTEDPMERRYLFDFFDALYYSQDNQKYIPGTNTGAVGTVAWARSFLEGGRQAMVIRDKRFKMVLAYMEIARNRVAGSIGSVGTYASGRGTYQYQIEVEDRDTDQKRIVNKEIGYHYYRWQKGPTYYEEVVVIGLQVRFYVQGEHRVIADENDDILLIPLDRSISSQYSMADREKLYSRSLHYVFNSLQIIKIKWYQTGIFQVVTTLVAVAMAIYDGGATLGAVLGLSGAAAIIATIVINLVIAEVLKVAFKLFAKLVGEELAMLIAIVAVVVGAYQVFDAGSLKGAPWAQDLLKAANGLTTAAMELKFEDLMNESSEFMKYVEQQTKTLETAQELLDKPVHLNPFVIFGESPTDYYNRTVHSGNIGVLGIEAVTNYTEIALTLPKLNDTLGDVL